MFKAVTNTAQKITQKDEHNIVNLYHVSGPISYHLFFDLCKYSDKFY